MSSIAGNYGSYNDNHVVCSEHTHTHYTILQTNTLHGRDDVYDKCGWNGLHLGDVATSFVAAR